MTPTKEQSEALEKFATGKSLRIGAFAGSGKTSTMKLLSRSTSRAGVMMCFNKSIAEDAAKSFPRNVSCQTTHGMAFRSMRDAYSTEKLTGSLNGGFVAAKLRINSQDYGAGMVVRGRQHAFLIVETLKRWMRSDRPQVMWFDVPLDGKLSTLTDDLAKQVAFRIAKDARDVWEKMIDPRHELPLGHDGYLKAWAMKRPEIPCDFLVLDEAQDTNPVVLGILKNQQAQTACVGDAHQCQPAGTMVAVVTKKSTSGAKAKGATSARAEWESVPIERIKRGDRVVSYNISGRHLRADGDLVTRVASRQFSGNLVRVFVGGKVIDFTPNHRCVVKINGGLKGKHVVYLMRKGGSFRIGKSQAGYTSQHGQLGFMARASNEGAEKVWVLSIHDSDREARIAEAVTAAKFGLPVIMFKDSMAKSRSANRNGDQAYIDAVFSALGDLTHNAIAALNAHGRHLEYPIWRKGAANLKNRRVTEIHACNLMDGMNFISGSERGHGRPDMAPIKVERIPFSGIVYSIEVANVKTYIANGFVTHNSIYQWRGAMNAMKELPCEQEARLSMSFRFGQAIADEATDVLRLLGETLPLRGNPNMASMVGPVELPDAELFRTNGRLIEALIDYIQTGLRPMVVGGVNDILAMVDGSEKLMRGQPVEYPLELFGFSHWGEVQEASEREDGQELRRWVRLIDQHGVDGLRKALTGLPTSEANANVIMSTGHKSKGREWGKVRLEDDFLRNVTIDGEASRANFAAGKFDEELRLFYVAMTRAEMQVEIPESLTEKVAGLSGIMREPGFRRAA